MDGWMDGFIQLRFFPRRGNCLPRQEGPIVKANSDWFRTIYVRVLHQMVYIKICRYGRYGRCVSFYRLLHVSALSLLTDTSSIVSSWISQSQSQSQSQTPLSTVADCELALCSCLREECSKTNNDNDLLEKRKCKIQEEKKIERF